MYNHQMSKLLARPSNTRSASLRESFGTFLRWSSTILITCIDMLRTFSVNVRLRSAERRDARALQGDSLVDELRKIC